MSIDVFTYLLDDIEPDQHPPWPSIVGETLHMLLDDEEFLSASLEYREFMKGSPVKIVTLYGQILIPSAAYDCLPDVCLDRRRKRRRLDHRHNKGMTQGQISRLDEKRGTITLIAFVAWLIKI
jgi:hypothetical protein